MIKIRVGVGVLKLMGFGITVQVRFTPKGRDRVSRLRTEIMTQSACRGRPDHDADTRFAGNIRGTGSRQTQAQKRNHQ